MDFNSLAVGQPFYVLQKSDKPSLQIGVVKTKSDPRSPYQTATPNVVDMTVTIGGSDVPFNNLPVAGESTTYNGGNTFVSGSREATLQAVDTMIQSSRKALEQVEFHKSVLKEGEKMLEALNPRYAEEKKRDRSIKSLEERQDAQDKKLDKILAFMQELSTPKK